MREFKIFRPFSSQFKAGVTLKAMGSFKEDDPEFQSHVRALGLGQPVFLQQTHSDQVVEVETMELSPQTEGDALMTDKKGLLLMVKVADCQGIVLYDSKKQVTAVVHSGWKGSVQNILGKTIRQMILTYQSHPSDLLLAVSPSLGPCCSEFTDPRRELPEFCHPFILAENHVDFWALSQKQATDEGVLPENIEISGCCTKCGPDFFSYRLGDVGRMAVFAKLL